MAGKGGGKNKNKTKEISIFSKAQCSQGETSEPFPFSQPTAANSLTAESALVQPGGDSAMETSSPAPRGVVEGCFNQQPSSPCPPRQASQTKQQRAGRRAGCQHQLEPASLRQDQLSTPGHRARSQLILQASLSWSVPVVWDFSGLSRLHPSTAGASPLPPDNAASLWDGPHRDRGIIPNLQGEKGWISSSWQETETRVQRTCTHVLLLALGPDQCAPELTGAELSALHSSPSNPNNALVPTELLTSHCHHVRLRSKFTTPA